MTVFTCLPSPVHLPTYRCSYHHHFLWVICILGTHVPFKMASKKFHSDPTLKQKILVSRKRHRTRIAGCGFAISKANILWLAIWPQFYIFPLITVKDLRIMDTHEQTKLGHFLFTEIHAKGWFTRLQEMQQKAEERAKSLRMDERNVKAIRGQWQSNSALQRTIVRMVSGFNGWWFFFFSDT